MSGAGRRGDREPLPGFGRILHAAQRGDEDAFARLWRQFDPALRRYLQTVAGPAADDIDADTWLQVARTIARFEGEETGFRAWLFTIARHRHIDWRRRNGRRNEAGLSTRESAIESVGVDPGLLAEESMATRRALGLIARLPEAQAEAVALRVIAGLDVGRVAHMMGRSPGAVRVLTHRGLRRLGEMLEGREDTMILGPGSSDGSEV